MNLRERIFFTSGEDTLRKPASPKLRLVYTSIFLYNDYGFGLESCF
jgi:hypothetical protein